MNEKISIESGSVVTADNKQIAYDHYQDGHAKVIILAHGFYNSKKAVLFKDMAGALIDEYDVIVMDFRGHGESTGLFCWTAREYMDLEAVLKFARENKDKIFI